MRQLSLIFILYLFGSTLVFSQKEDKLSSLRTDKKIVTVDQATSPYYSIQILALTQPPQSADFFKNIDMAREFVCTDGFVRYTVGQYNSFKEALAELEQVKQLGYEGAFVVNTSKLGTTTPSNGGQVFKIDPDKDYSIQVSAFRFPVYLSYFEQLESGYLMEFYMKDKIYRYCYGRTKGRDVESELGRIRSLGYKDAFIVDLEKYMPYQIE